MKIAHIHNATKTVRFISEMTNSLENLENHIVVANGNESQSSPFYWLLVGDDVKEGDVVDE